MSFHRIGYLLKVRLVKQTTQLIGYFNCNMGQIKIVGYTCKEFSDF